MCRKNEPNDTTSQSLWEKIMTKNEKRIKEIFKVFRPYIFKAMEEAADDDILDANDIREILSELDDVLQKFLSAKKSGDELEEELTDYLLDLHEVRIEDEIRDLILRRVVRSLKYDIVKRRERQRLAREIARLALKEEKHLDKKLLAAFTGKNGILAELIEYLSDGGDVVDKKFSELVLDASEKAALAVSGILSEKDFKKALALAVKILEHAENKKSAENELLEFADYFLARFEVMDAMRKSFTGLLLGDIMLATLGAALGIKQRLSLSDFIVYIGVKVFETEILHRLPKNDLKKMKTSLKKIK